MSNCPECGAAGAYVGFTAVECVSIECRYFSAKLALEVKSTGGQATSGTLPQSVAPIRAGTPVFHAAPTFQTIRVRGKFVGFHPAPPNVDRIAYSISPTKLHNGAIETLAIVERPVSVAVPSDPELEFDGTRWKIV